jgi:hypothetical protein
MAANFAGRKNLFNAVIEGSFERFPWNDLTYKAVHLQVPPSAVFLHDLTNSYLLYGRTENFKNIVRAELPKGSRAEIAHPKLLDGLIIDIVKEKNENKPQPEHLATPRLIVLRDKRIFLARKSWEDSPIHPYEDTIEESIEQAGDIFSSKKYAQAWDSI